MEKLHDDFIKLSQTIHFTTKMDVAFVDSIGSVIYQYTNHSIPAVLGTPENDYLYMHEVLKQQTVNDYFHHTNAYGLEYIATGNYRNDSFNGQFIIGPFISSISILSFIQDVIVRNNLPAGERKQLEHFYQSLPVINQMDTPHFGELLVNLTAEKFIEAKSVNSDSKPPLINYDQVEMTREEDKQIIEKRYHHQNKMMDAIRRGNMDEVKEALDTMLDIFVGFSDRIPGSPLRSSKNMALVSNTSFRVAAENSGVHPIYLHIISERFAILIEKTDKLPNLKKLIISMAYEYCELVQSFSTGNYSPVVKKSMDYIMMNLGEPLTLRQIATDIHVNPSYLSRKFKEESGRTLTEFITAKRIEESKLYLKKRSGTVTDIALMMGFNDLNYFTKVFKRLTGYTPSQYAKINSL